ncbi:MAG: hypothetical protein AAF581_10530 [Planctomycetota bacterium]
MSKQAVALTLVALAWTSGCTNTGTTDPMGATTQPSTNQPGTEQPTEAHPALVNGNAAKPTTQQSPVVKELVERLGNENATSAAAPTDEQAQALAKEIFAAVESHDMNAGLDLNLSEAEVRALYKPSIANIMAPGLRLAAERKWHDLERLTFERTVHLDRVEITELVLLNASTSLKKPTHQFPRIELHILADEDPIVLILGQVMSTDGGLRYLTLDLRRG